MHRMYTGYNGAHSAGQRLHARPRRISMVLEAAPALDDAALKAFAATLRGDLLVSAHPEYDLARRVWNGMIDKRPAVIVRCHGTNDVLRAVEFARANELLVSVRGGRHHLGRRSAGDRR